jgi:phosphoenolpyruvate carboxylase
MVKQAVALLGEVILQELGPRAYGRIEAVRQSMASTRGKEPSLVLRKLKKTLKFFSQLSSQEQMDFACSYTLMLELMNACENAYRAFRLRQRRGAPPKGKVNSLSYVLTAHPTEARSPENIKVFHEIQLTLTEAFFQGFEPRREQLNHLLEIAWRISIVRKRKPSVEDEAEHIYHTVLREDILQVLLNANQDLVPVYLRSWVGGDKDGHPGVNEKTMVRSLQLSRDLVLKFMRRQLQEVKKTIQWLGPEGQVTEILRSHRLLERAVSLIRILGEKDGARIRHLQSRLENLRVLYVQSIGVPHPALNSMVQLTRTFPGMVVPLELRESSDLVLEAIKNPRLPIVRMLKKLKVISVGGDPRWYVGGIIVSMARTLEHIQAASVLVARVFGEIQLPVVPLFEEGESLRQSDQVIQQMIRDPKIKKAIDQSWKGRLEVMVGYSDSAKEGGVLPSRVAIEEAMRRIDHMVSTQHIKKLSQITPLFFHGSGGSVDRGGGSLREQIEWWPKSALRNYKATIQGEMVERSFASPEITYGQIETLVKSASQLILEHRAPRSSAIVLRFAKKVTQEYQKQISSPHFLEVVEKATPYPYLTILRIGSRPARRSSAPFSIQALRAIPWVLCWTQTRVLFPTWWGVGTAWKGLSQKLQKDLVKAYQKDSLFRAYVKLLGFTLAKVELQIWKLYLERSPLDAKMKLQTMNSFEGEFKAALEFIQRVSHSSQLLWYRPWLGRSIQLRSAMIHPLNLLQIIAFERKDLPLIRITVTGIASGMMTTG